MIELKEQFLRKLLIGLFAALFVLALVGSAAFFWGRSELKKSLPEISGRITLKGLSAPVDRYRDEYGIPHIYAQDTNDLMFAVGFVSAQDRLWQMDLTRRAATGRLAEIFGEEVIAADLLARTMGFDHVADLQFEKLSPSSAAALESFSDGVNVCVARMTTLPPEFRILKYEPKSWRPTDSLAISRLGVSDARPVHHTHRGRRRADRDALFRQGRPAARRDRGNLRRKQLLGDRSLADEERLATFGERPPPQRHADAVDMVFRPPRRRRL
jgi:hypothetical protein